MAAVGLGGHFLLQILEVVSINVGEVFRKRAFLQCSEVLIMRASLYEGWKMKLFYPAVLLLPVLTVVWSVLFRPTVREMLRFNWMGVLTGAFVYAVTVWLSLGLHSGGLVPSAALFWWGFWQLMAAFLSLFICWARSLGNTDKPMQSARVTE